MATPVLIIFVIAIAIVVVIALNTQKHRGPLRPFVHLTKEQSRYIVMFYEKS